MSKGELVDLLGHVIDGLDAALMTSELVEDPPNWQLVFAVRKHLNDLQEELLRTVLAEENAAYTILTATIQAAANSLDQVIAHMEKVDQILTWVAKISADVDQVLKLVP